jgi:hypothetical protein
VPRFMEKRFKKCTVAAHFSISPLPTASSWEERAGEM